jgi:hypothetical protein
VHREIKYLYQSRHKGDRSALICSESKSSLDEPLVQLADYVAGSIRHKIDEMNNPSYVDEYLEDKGKIFFC